ncbi:MAG: undecaprenyl-diphosphate phosphatase [Christensenellales bacterium]
MAYLEALILGLIQGLTEFLPVSSSGHLVLIQQLGMGEKSLVFNLMLHVATLFAVCLVYRKKLLYLIKNPKSKELRFLLLATLPTIVIALLMRLYVDIMSERILPFGFMVTTVFLIFGSLNWKKQKQMDYSTALLTGVAQGLAVIGGISRSGSTICTQIIMGQDKEQAGDFAFLLSIPIILGSAVVELVAFKGFERVDVGPLILGMIAAFLSGALAIKLFLRALKSRKLLPFAAYTFILSIVSFVLFF